MIIGLVGFIGSGKDTAAEYLIEKYGFQRDSFAAPLKDAVASVFGWDREMLEGRTDESRAWRECADPWWSQRLGREVTPRHTLQLWGTEVARQAYHDDIWIASLEHRVRNTTDNVVITDCRFPNEIAAIQSMGGRVIRINRGNIPDWYQEAVDYLDFPAGKPPPNLPHISEWAWMRSNWDASIHNNGDIAQLHQQVDMMIDILGIITYNDEVNASNKEPK